MPQLRSCCFPAGALVHTRDGLRSIESVLVGTHVLSRSAKTGEQGWKRVLRTVRHDARPLCRIRLYTKMGDEFVAQDLLATDRHLFYVAGYYNNGGFSDDYWEELDKPIGWRPAERLQSHQLVQLADGTTMHVSFVDHLWKTRSADHA